MHRAHNQLKDRLNIHVVSLDGQRLLRFLVEKARAQRFASLNTRSLELIPGKKYEGPSDSGLHRIVAVGILNAAGEHATARVRGKADHLRADGLGKRGCA